MIRWKRRIRGALGLGLTWAAAWFGAGMVLLVMMGPGAADVPFPLFFGLLGFLGGTIFSVFLGTLAKKRHFAELSLPRFAAWGALGGAVLASAFSALSGQLALLPLLGTVFASAGAVSAAGTLALARRASESSLPASRSAELPDVASDETRRLPNDL